MNHFFKVIGFVRPGIQTHDLPHTRRALYYNYYYYYSLSLDIFWQFLIILIQIFTKRLTNALCEYQPSLLAINNLPITTPYTHVNE